MWRYLNMFVLIGVALVIISLVGFATGNKFLTEPGQPINQMGSLIYLGAGAIMLVNGYVSIKQAELHRAQTKAHPTPQPEPADAVPAEKE